MFEISNEWTVLKFAFLWNLKVKSYERSSYSIFLFTKLFFKFFFREKRVRRNFLSLFEFGIVWSNGAEYRMDEQF